MGERNLIHARREVGVELTAEKSKYMLLSRQKNLIESWHEGGKQVV
jgi:hypothetical protein